MLVVSYKKYYYIALFFITLSKVRVIYAGDSASDEFAIEKLKGMAYTFRVTNEDSSAITKTMADFWLPGGGTN